MNVTTYTRRYNTLLRDISIHPHKDELLNIMYQQLQEDEVNAANLCRQE